MMLRRQMSCHGVRLTSFERPNDGIAMCCHVHGKKFHEDIVAQLRGLADAIPRMPNQLFVQAFLVIELVMKVKRG